MGKEFPIIEVWRMSASRPWQLEKTTPKLIEHLKYSGQLKYYLIESVLQPEYSNECIAWGIYNGYDPYVIDPARGQGEAIKYFLDNIVSCPYSLKWEDDFMPVMDIPLDDCVLLMDQYPHINQICFNKRETMKSKRAQAGDGSFYQWQKEQRYFTIDDLSGLASVEIPLVIKEKWWFGTGLWRTSFIRPIFKAWESNTHNLFNHHVVYPLARTNKDSTVAPSPQEIEDKIGCYIYGKHGDPPMVEHTGRGDSLWMGELQERWKKEGRKIKGI